MADRPRIIALSLIAGLLLPLAACQTSGERRGVEVVVEEMPERPAWLGIAQEDDVERLERLEAAWDEALAAARRRYGRQIAAEGALLDPEAALPRAAPPPGSYRCRMIRIGATGRRTRPFTAYRPFFCHVGVEGDLLSLTKQTGSQRPGGYLHVDRDDRLIFLGSLALGSEDVPLPYGEDPERDMIGLFERVGPFRYRLVVPWPRADSRLDVFELVPAIPD